MKRLDTESPVAWMVTYSIISVTTVTGNVLVLLAVATTPQLRTIANLFIVALAVADLIVGVNKVTSVFWVNKDTHWAFEEHYWFCEAYETLTFAACIASVLTLFHIAIDRYLYIMHPFLYQRKVTWKRTGVCLLCLAPACTLHAGLLRFLEPDPDPNSICSTDVLFPKTPASTYTHVSLYALLSLVTLCLYTSIFRKAAAQAAAINAVTASVSNNDGTSTREAEKRKLAKNIRLVKRMALVWGIFVCLWTPYFCMAVVRLHVKVAGDVKLAAAALATCNSCLNVVVYACQDSEFRAAFKRLLGLGRKIREANAGPSQLRSIS